MPAVSKSQRRLMGMAYAHKIGKLDLGDLPKVLAKKVKDLSDNMSKKDLKDFAETKEDNLPDRKDENVTSGNVPGMGSVSLPDDPGSIEDFSNIDMGSGDCPIYKRMKKKKKKLKRKKFKFIKDFRYFSDNQTNI